MRAKRVIPSVITGAVLAASGVTAYAATSEYDGPMRFEQTTLTVSSEVPGVDLTKVTAPWAAEGTVQFKIVDGPADIEFRFQRFGKMVGAKATRTFVDGTLIGHCEVGVEAVTYPVLTHEMGHCLGLSHEHRKAGTNMHWVGGDYEAGWSDTVTEYDLGVLAQHYAGTVR